MWDVFEKNITCGCYKKAKFYRKTTQICDSPVKKQKLNVKMRKNRR